MNEKKPFVNNYFLTLARATAKMLPLLSNYVFFVHYYADIFPNRMAKIIIIYSKCT